jgi:RNA polymerase nonessential primary-like sigma factor
MSSNPTQMLIDRLRREYRWPIPDLDYEDLTFLYNKHQLGFLRNELAYVDAVLQLRPIEGLEAKVYIVTTRERTVSRFAVRKVAIHLTTSRHGVFEKRAAKLSELVFFVVTPEGFAVLTSDGQKALKASQDSTPLERFYGPPGFCDFLTWESIGLNKFEVPGLKGPKKAIRLKVQCSEGFLEKNAPEFLPLFHEISGIDTMEQWEEDVLFAQMRDGSPAARDEIFIYHLRVVFDCSARLYLRNEYLRPDFHDIFHGGLEGLVLALDRYTVARGHRFSSYCWSWVQGRCERSLAEFLWPISIPYYVYEELRDYPAKSAVRDYTRASLEAKSEIVAQGDNELGIAELLVRAGEWEPLDDHHGDELEDDTGVPRRQCDSFMFEMDGIIKHLSMLSETRRLVLEFRYGLHPKAPGNRLTLDEVGCELALTRERVRQLELKGLEELREKMKIGNASKPKTNR